jgi:hypothetical protein
VLTSKIWIWYPSDMKRWKNIRNYKLRALWTSSALLQTNVVISTIFLCIPFNVFNNPYVFLYVFYWCSLTKWRWSRYLEICRCYDKLCVNNIILILLNFLLLLCEVLVTVTTQRAGGQRICGTIPVVARDILFSETSIPSLGPIQPAI